MRNALRFAALAAAFLAGPCLAQAIQVQRPVPYAEDNDIAGKIKRECAIDVKLADFLGEFARKRGIAIEFVAEADAAASGRVLVLEIKDAVSQGNAWLGHRKSTSVRGKLYRDGELEGSFRGRRDSMGGAFAGYKGSCSVLGRTVRALGEDIAGWLAAPSMDADLGDLE